MLSLKHRDHMNSIMHSIINNNAVLVVYNQYNNNSSNNSKWKKEKKNINQESYLNELINERLKIKIHIYIITYNFISKN